MTTKRWYILGAVVIGVVALLWYMRRRGALSATDVATPAVGVRANIGSNLFSVHDRSPGNIMANLFSPETTPVAAGPVSPTAPGGFNIIESQRAIRSIVG